MACVRVHSLGWPLRARGRRREHFRVSAELALRAKLLASRPEDLDLAPTPELLHVWAALMEMAVSSATVTLVAVADGATSLYVSTGGGVIGGGHHETVRAAYRKFPRPWTGPSLGSSKWRCRSR